MARTLRRLGLALIVIAVLGFGGYRSALAYLAWRETVAPSTRQVLLTSDGRAIPLEQPRPATPASLPLATSAVAAPPGGSPPAALTPVAPAPPDGPSAPVSILPPERLLIPKIDVSWPVVLATVDHLPRFKGVGWLMGSTFPGAPGNLVLFGHAGGAYGTFMRLPELRAGDEFSVVTAEAEYRYRVREHFETTPDDVGVLAPTAGATATLITCSGPWDAAAQSNELRLIVVADLVERVARSSDG